MRVDLRLLALASCVLFFAGCGQKFGLIRSPYDAKPYYVDKRACPGYLFYYSDPNFLHCVDANGNPTGVRIAPLSEDQYKNIVYEENLNRTQEQMDRMNRTLERQTDIKEMQMLNKLKDQQKLEQQVQQLQLQIQNLNNQLMQKK